MKNVRAVMKINYPAEPGNELIYNIVFLDDGVYTTVSSGLLFDSYEEMRLCKIEKIYRRIIEENVAGGGSLSGIFSDGDTTVFVYGNDIPWHYVGGGPYIFNLKGPVFRRRVRTVMRPICECSDERLKNFGHPELPQKNK